MSGGPYFDELHHGQVFDAAPSMTMTPGVAAMHQAILGDRLRLPVDGELTRVVTGSTTPWPIRVWCVTSRSGSRRWCPTTSGPTCSTAA
jgi:acyl dehydratase